MAKISCGLSVLYLFLLGALTWAGNLPVWMVMLTLGASGVTFLVYGIDKSAARAGRWRIPENTLHLLGLVGGWPGALAAQELFRHKTRKTSFRLVFWFTAGCNAAFLLLFLVPSLRPHLHLPF